jgi:hypothetical protein
MLSHGGRHDAASDLAPQADEEGDHHDERRHEVLAELVAGDDVGSGQVKVLSITSSCLS